MMAHEDSLQVKRGALLRRGVLALLAAFGLFASTTAEASVPKDFSFKVDRFAAPPQLAMKPITGTLAAIEQDAGCTALCDLAASVEAHPFGQAVAVTPLGTQDAWGNYRFTSELETSHNRFGFTGHYW
ncbi:MAG: hypothetical protein K1Y01_07370, partial [Vicinamibacteria bacterium]|nr:hypothetical protein [Vicinamibacteria bacterium]